MNPTSKLTGCVVAFGAMSMSALLIHATRGLIESHFTVFIMLGLLTMLGRPSVILVATATVAVQHLGTFLVFPKSVFNYDATIWSVVLHAVFVLLQTGPSLFISGKFGRLIQAQGLAAESVSSYSSANLRSKLNTGASTGESMASVNEIVQTSEERLIDMQRATEENAKVAHETLQLAESSKSLAADGTRELGALSKAIEEIRESADKMQRVIGVIDGIASQTNLLSLNAAVEAARAGEAGRGFGVVAEEVRALARRSSDAAKETAGMITQALTATRQGIEISQRVNTSLERIHNANNDVYGYVKSIAESSDLQKSRIAETREAVEKIGTAADAIAGVAQTASESTTEVLKMAEHLESVVQHMLKGQSAVAGPAGGAVAGAVAGAGEQAAA